MKRSIKNANAKKRNDAHYHVLIAEDEIAILRVVSDALRDAGFTVTETKDGEEALTHALAEHPDLMLLDIQMPKMDGIEVLKKLRQDVWGKNARVMLLTRFAKSETISEALALGAYEYLIKMDWDIEDIIAQVKKALDIPASGQVVE